MVLFISLLILDGCKWPSPTIRPLSTLELPGGANAVVIQDGYAFVTRGKSGLVIVDLREPKIPRIVASLDVELFVNSLSASGNRVYLATANGGHILIIDVTTLTAPHIIGSYKTGGNALAVEARDDIVFVASGGVGFVILDLADPAQPRLLSEIQFSEQGRESFVYDVNVVGDLAYIAGRSHDQIVLNIADPAQPVTMSQHRDLTPSTPTGSIRVWRKYGYAKTSGGVYGFDLSMPTHPEVISAIDVPAFVMDVEPYDSNLYVAELFALRIYDVSKPALPREIAQFRVEQGAAVDVAENYAVLADKIFGLYVFDVRPFRKQ